jgi:hypothetical protein
MPVEFLTKEPSLFKLLKVFPWFLDVVPKTTKTTSQTRKPLVLANRIHKIHKNRAMPHRGFHTNPITPCPGYKRKETPWIKESWESSSLMTDKTENIQEQKMCGETNNISVTEDVSSAINHLSTPLCLLAIILPLKLKRIPPNRFWTLKT